MCKPKPQGQDPVAVLTRIQDVLRNEDLLYAAEGLRVPIGALHDQKKRIAALKAELAAARAESRELLTIAHMDGYHRGSQGLKALIINNTILRARVVELKEALGFVIGACEGSYATASGSPRGVLVYLPQALEQAKAVLTVRGEAPNGL